MNTLKLLAMYSTRLSANDLKAVMVGYASFLNTGKIDDMPKSENVVLNLEVLINTTMDEMKAEAEKEARVKAMEQAYNNVLSEAQALIEQTRMEAVTYSEEETPEEKKARISKARSEAGKKGAMARLGISNEANSSKSEQNQANQANEANSSKSEFCLANSSKTKQNEDLLDFASTDTQELDFACEEGSETAENEAKNAENEAKSSSRSFLNFSFSSLSSLLSTDTSNDIILDNKNIPSARTRTRGEPPKIDLSFVRPDYLPIVEEWLEYKRTERKETYKTPSTLKKMYDKLLTDSNGDPQTAQLIINKAIANRSQGFFPITTTQNQRYNGTAQRDHEVDLNDGRKREYISTI